MLAYSSTTFPIALSLPCFQNSKVFHDSYRVISILFCLSKLFPHQQLIFLKAHFSDIRVLRLVECIEEGNANAENTPDVFLPYIHSGRAALSINSSSKSSTVLSSLCSHTFHQYPTLILSSPALSKTLYPFLYMFFITT